MAIGALVLTTPGLAAAETPEAPDLSGRWAQLKVLTEQAELPVVGKVTTATRFVSVVTIKKKSKGKKESKGGDNRYTLHEKICTITTKGSNPKIKTIIPKPFARALSGSRLSASLVWKKDRWELRTRESLEVRGAKLVKPATDKLPTSANDPRVVDADGDRHPGLTLRIRGMIKADVRVVQRARLKLTGIVRSADRVDGIVTWSREQEAVGSTNPFVSSVPKVKAHPDRSKSSFRLRRLAEDATCASLLRDAERIFGK